MLIISKSLYFNTILSVYVATLYNLTITLIIFYEILNKCHINILNFEYYHILINLKK